MEARRLIKLKKIYGQIYGNISPKNWQNQRGCVWLKRSPSCSLLYRGSATTCPYTAPLKSLAYRLDTWCGLERQKKIFSGTQDSQTYLFFGGTVFWELCTLWNDKGWFLDPLFWSRASHKRGHSRWWQYHSGTFPKGQKQRHYKGSYVAI